MGVGRGDPWAGVELGYKEGLPEFLLDLWRSKLSSLRHCAGFYSKSRRIRSRGNIGLLPRNSLRSGFEGLPKKYQPGTRARGREEASVLNECIGDLA
jgi:hypothetical protein